MVRMVVQNVYIAGPMRGKPGLNFAAFDAAAREATRRGFKVFSPADLDRAAGIDAQACADHLRTHGAVPASIIRSCIRRDVHCLIDRMTGEFGDAIALLPGWEASVGATAELGIARWAGLKVLSAETFLPIDARLRGYIERG